MSALAADNASAEAKRCLVLPGGWAVLPSTAPMGLGQFLIRTPVPVRTFADKRRFRRRLAEMAVRRHPPRCHVPSSPAMEGWQMLSRLAFHCNRPSPILEVGPRPLACRLRAAQRRDVIGESSLGVHPALVGGEPSGACGAIDDGDRPAAAEDLALELVAGSFAGVAPDGGDESVPMVAPSGGRVD